jgi:methylase of polypeptide subunit release factors
VNDALLDEPDDAGRLVLAMLCYGTRVDAQRLRAVAARTVDALVSIGLVEERDGFLVCPYRITPTAGLVVVADQPSAGPDAVASPSRITERLAELLPSAMDGAFADVGCGPGLLAMLAVRRGASAVGTDISPRALAFAEFNCALNGVAVDLRLGHLAEPLLTHDIDLLVSQPPFMAMPASSPGVRFFHGGAQGDELALELAGDLARVLSNDGMGILRFDSPVPPGEAISRLPPSAGALAVSAFSTMSFSADMAAIVSAELEDPSLGEHYAKRAPHYRRHLETLPGGGQRSQVLLLARRSTVPAAIELVVDELPRRWERLDRYRRGVDAVTTSDDEIDQLSVQLLPGAVAVHEENLTSGAQQTWLRLPPGSFGAHSELSPDAVELLRAFSVPTRVSDVAEQGLMSIAELRAFVRTAVHRGLLVLA